MWYFGNQPFQIVRGSARPYSASHDIPFIVHWDTQRILLGQAGTHHTDLHDEFGNAPTDPRDLYDGGKIIPGKWTMGEIETSPNPGFVHTADLSHFHEGILGPLGQATGMTLQKPVYDGFKLGGWSA